MHRLHSLLCTFTRRSPAATASRPPTSRVSLVYAGLFKHNKYRIQPARKALVGTSHRASLGAARVTKGESRFPTRQYNYPQRDNAPAQLTRALHLSILRRAKRRNARLCPRCNLSLAQSSRAAARLEISATISIAGHSAHARPQKSAEQKRNFPGHEPVFARREKTPWRIGWFIGP